MQVYEKIRFLRELKGWTQEEMADQLNMSVSGYGGIERGEIDTPLSRLQLIAKIFGVSLMELFDLNERVTFYVGNENTLISQINSLPSNSITLQYELEKSYLMLEQKDKLLEQKDKEIELLKQQNVDLRAMIHLLQKKE